MSLQWLVSGDLTEELRVTLREHLDAVFLDEHEQRPGWSKLCPDVVVYVRPGDRSEPNAIIAHWEGPLDGLPTTREDWVIDVVTEALRLCFSRIDGPRAVRTGLGTV
jgi:hypothetical protein